MQQNTFGVIFYLRRYKINKDGKTPIYARITVNGKRADIAIKRSIDENSWNVKKGMAKGSRQEITQLNNFLEKYRSGIVESYQSLMLEKKLLTAELIKSRFLGDDRKEYTVCKLMDFHNEDQKESLEWGTMKNYYTTQKYLRLFIKDRFNTTDKFLAELTYKFIVDFETYLKNTKNKHGKPCMQNNGVMKHLERFCKMVNLAVKQEWIKSNPFLAYQLKFDKVQRDFLTREELQRLEQKNINILRLQIVRDMFVFSCYTGLAYVDTFSLTPANIVQGVDGEYWIRTVRKKTGMIVIIPILPKAQVIIDKYKMHPSALAEGKVFPGLSNQKLNSYLKELADICGISKPLTFHIARHTFATTITLSNGVPIESVSKMLGHSKFSTTQIYAKVIESKLATDMAILRGKLA